MRRRAVHQAHRDPRNTPDAPAIPAPRPRGAPRPERLLRPHTAPPRRPGSRNGIDPRACRSDRSGRSGRRRTGGRAALARSSSTATVFLPDRAIEQAVTPSSPGAEFSPVGTLRSAGGLRRSRSSTPCSSASAELGSSLMNSCRPFSRSSLRESGPSAAPRQPWEASALCCDADSGRRRAERHRLLESRRSGSLVALPRPRRVEDRDDGMRPRSGRGRASSCRSARRPTCPQRGLRAACSTPRPGDSDGRLDAVGELNTRPRIFAQEQVPVEVDVVAQARDRGAALVRGPTRPCSRA